MNLLQKELADITCGSVEAKIIGEEWVEAN